MVGMIAKDRLTLQESEVKYRTRTRHRWMLPLLTALMLLSAALPMMAAPEAVPTSIPSGPHATTLRVAAVDRAMGGDYEGALADLRKAAGLAPEDAAVAEALAVVEEYAAYRQKYDAARAAELERTGQRIRDAMVAFDYFKDESEPERKKTLRDQVAKLVEARGGIARGEDLLERMTPDEAVALRQKSLDAIAKSRTTLDDSVAVLKGDDGPYAQAFRRSAAALDAALLSAHTAWAAVATDDIPARRESARQVRHVEYGMENAFTDVNMMVSEQPWGIGLMRARIARQLVAQSADLKQYDWYTDFLQHVRQQAEAAITADPPRWFDALTAYASLQDLEPGDEEFRARLKDVRRHVRALGMYTTAKPGDDPNVASMGVVDPNVVSQGPEDPQVPTTAPASEPAEPRWQEMTQGVDAEMVRTAIRQLDDHYVSALGPAEFRKVVYGALQSIQVLAQTPGVEETFPGLADPEKKEAFLAAIAAQMTDVMRRDRVDATHLWLALNAVVRASEASVQIPTSVLAMEFADGFLEELDKFSAMVWPHDLDDFRKQTMGEFCGVGIQISKEDGEPLKVVTPLADSPALRMGIRTGDLIIAVDGRRTEDLDLDKLVRMITGKEGTKVALRVQRPGEAQPMDLDVVREQIHIRTVKGWRRVPGGDGGEWDFLIDPEHKIAYIRLTQFYRDSHEHMARVLAALKDNGVRSVILDLRFNPGGLLDTARMICDEFLADGTIVSTEGEHATRRAWTAGPQGSYQAGDLVVLVNEFSASASEIVSGAIADLNRGLIVGRRSYGKGSVQHVIPIPRHEAYLKLTTAYYYLPSGRCLHRKDDAAIWGVEPQVEIPDTPEMRKLMLDMRRKADLLDAEVDEAELARDLQEQYDTDVQLRTAVFLLRMKQLRNGETVAAVNEDK